MNGGGNYGNRLDNKQRGNASQLLERYRGLARDAQQAGDRVTAEYYLQYADHYYRVLGDYRDKAPEPNRPRREFYEDDSAGYAGPSEDNDADDGDDDDRTESRDDNRGDRSDNRPEARSDENRGNWRDDRPNRDRDRNQNRDQSQGNNQGNNQTRGDQPRRDGENRDRDNRDRDNRDRPAWNNRNSEAPRAADGNRGDQPRRDRDRDRDRPERRPEQQRAEAARPAFEPNTADEGPIPGLPGPATLRASRPAEAPVEDRPARAPRAPRREPTEIAVEAVAPEPVAATEDVAPRRRGRPRKAVVDTVEG